MEERDLEELIFVESGSEGGITWTRYTDGVVDYMIEFNPKTKIEKVTVIERKEKKEDHYNA